ncbi:hypothetical protein [Methylobacterium marchantiae]|uniref:Uncharacterized protein n=1 Tax=Methylobacterium marchantiae TaxID=600331 RepID=A0ABW3WY51_9HYPH|nr:hypothetical protein AIGOOFII_3395 [Methylobacterium marchantiae]
MTAARPFRWLLALVTLILPTSVMAGRNAAEGCERSGTQDIQSQVVFRHYI